MRDDERWVDFVCNRCKSSSSIEEYYVVKFGEDAWNECDNCGAKCVRRG